MITSHNFSTMHILNYHLSDLHIQIHHNTEGTSNNFLLYPTVWISTTQIPGCATKTSTFSKHTHKTLQKSISEASPTFAPLHTKIHCALSAHTGDVADDRVAHSDVSIAARTGSDNSFRSFSSLARLRNSRRFSDFDRRAAISRVQRASDQLKRVVMPLFFTAFIHARWIAGS